MRIWHTAVVDMVAAARAFVSVSEQNSFTVGAATIGVPQPVVSRRVAALEQNLGQALIDRHGRRVRLTTFGREMLGPARNLVRAADALHYRARRALTQTVTLLVPDLGTSRHVAELAAAVRHAGANIDVRVARPSYRADQGTTTPATVALVAVPQDAAAWSVPLGLAAARDLPPTVFVESLRPRRGSSEVVRIWLDPEDDVPHVRDKLSRLRDQLALSPPQLAIAESLAEATAHALGGDDLLLCSPAQAARLGLQWRPIAELQLTRGYAPAGADDAPLASPLQTMLHERIDEYLNGPPT